MSIKTNLNFDSLHIPKFSTGQIECQRVYATVSLWSLLLLFETEGTGMPQHRLDCRMCRAKTSCKDRQLHPHSVNTYYPCILFYYDHCALVEIFDFKP